MSDTTWTRVREVFETARERSGSERERFVEQACGPDEHLRRDVLRLLALHARSEGFLEPPQLEDPAKSAVPNMAGRKLGRYTVRGSLGSGGMGVVYAAEQEGTQRLVALKMMRTGLASPEASRRFRLEAEVLGRLHHPNIALIHDAGTVRDERGELVPYFAMEYVEGAHTILTHCAAEELDTDARIRLFLDVCDAIQHGHERGIIHRDLKPGNILVDDSGRVKVIDFGVARAHDPDGDSASLHTAAGYVLGTLQYMAPEQLSGGAHAVDTRADVYALGVVLYELLTGRTPYDFGKVSIIEAALVLARDAPPTPSSIDRQIDQDLDWIVLGALEKDRSRRYATVSELAADLRRYLAHEPVLASPPSRRYRLSRFLQRHRGAAVAGVLVFVALSVGLTLTLLALRREREQAMRTRAMMNASTSFMRMNPLLIGEGGDFAEIERTLAKAAEEARALGPGESRFANEFMLAIAASYESLGLSPKAYRLRIEVLERMGEADDTDDLLVAKCLASVDRASEAYELQIEHLTPPHPELAASIRGMARKAMERGDHALALERAVESRAMIAELDPLPGRQLVGALVFEADVLHQSGDTHGALVRLDEAVSIVLKIVPRPHITVARTLVRRATMRQDTRDYDGAMSDLTRAREIYDTALPEGHPDAAEVMGELGLLYKDTGNFEEASIHLDDARSRQVKIFGEGSVKAANSDFNIARLLADQGLWSEAEERGRIAFHYYRDDSRGPEVATFLGRVLIRLGRPAEALELLEPAHEERSRTVHVERWERQKTASILGEALAHVGPYERALSLLSESVPRIAEDREPDHYRTAQAWQRLVDYHLLRGENEQAERYRQRITPKSREHPIVAATVPLEGMARHHR